MYVLLGLMCFIPPEWWFKTFSIDFWPFFRKLYFPSSAWRHHEQDGDSPQFGVNVNPIIQLKFFQQKMGSGDSKLHFRKAVIQLTTKTQVSLCPRDRWSAAFQPAKVAAGGRWTQMCRLNRFPPKLKHLSTNMSFILCQQRCNNFRN